MHDTNINIEVRSKGTGNIAFANASGQWGFYVQPTAGTANQLTAVSSVTTSAPSLRATGTDTDAFAYATDGIASALISLPLRYMHTTVESVHKQDVEEVIKLIYHSLKSIKNNQDFRYLK